MINANRLYHDSDFNDFLITNARRNLLGRSDYIHEVFAEMIEESAQTMQDAKRAAWRVAKRMKKYDERERHYSYIDGYDIGPDETADPESVLWEDNHVL
jgi:hypothetical protein